MKKFIKVTLSIVVGVLIIGDLAGSGYLFNYAFNKTGYSSQIAKNFNKDDQWFLKQKPQVLEQTTRDNLKLKARFLPAAKKTTKTVIVIHGFGSSSKYMGQYAKMFHQAGYNVLAPDNRSFGMSQGQYTGYGWKDRIDISKWIKRLNQKYGKTSEIGLFGVSMGAATVMYTLGKHPKNVKFAIADCGYTTISGELNYQLKDKFNLPSFPLVPTASLFGKFLAGYNFYQASTKNTLKNNHVPLFVIHGSKDDFVPTKNAYQNYDYTKGPKKLWIVDGAGHANSFSKARLQYIDKATSFASKYFNN